MIETERANYKRVESNPQGSAAQYYGTDQQQDSRNVAQQEQIKSEVFNPNYNKNDLVNNSDSKNKSQI